MHLAIVRRAPPIAALLLAMVLLAACGATPAPTLTASTAATATPAASVALTATSAPTATVAPTLTPMPTATPVPTAPAQATVTPAQAGEPSIVGHWDGAVTVEGQKLTTIADFKIDSGALKGTVGFPQQGAVDLALSTVTQQGSKVHFEVLPAPRTAVFNGSLQGADNISGIFAQSGITGTFELQRTIVAAPSPVPYKAEDITFKNGNVTLAGTLTLPGTAGPYPAVVLISGSGAQNRNEEIFGFKIFEVLADYLTRHGIAVLRYDDRGVGGSSPGTPQDTSETYAGDVSAAVEYLKARPEINPKQIGLLGHSEGGIIAPMVATTNSDVAFIILMSGPGQPGSQIIMEQAQLIAKANGASPDELAKQAALEKQVIDAALTGQGWDEAKAAIRQQYEAAAAAMTDSQRQAIGDVNQWVEKNVDTQVETLTSPWYQFFLHYDPAPTLEKVQVPVLALFGGLDTQVPATPNRDAIMAALDKGGNKDHTAIIFPDANHLYQSAKTGSPSEYAQLKPEFTAGFLDTITNWILARFPSPAG
jgi:pimeloyl-ACP methyl ester carboxylesterase